MHIIRSCTADILSISISSSVKEQLPLQEILTDWQMNGWTDNVILIYPPKKVVCGVYNHIKPHIPFLLG